MPNSFVFKFLCLQIPLSFPAVQTIALPAQFVGESCQFLSTRERVLLHNACQPFTFLRIGQLDDYAVSRHTFYNVHKINVFRRCFDSLHALLAITALLR